MTRTTACCPGCRSTKIYRRVGSSDGGGRAPRKGDPDANYRCSGCGGCFDEPDEKETDPRGGHRGPTDADTMLQRIGFDPDEIRERMGIET